MSSVTRCKSCGAFVQEADHFCWACGTRQGVQEAAGAPKPAAAVAEPEPDVQLTTRRAFLAQRRGDLEEAERLLREALTRSPESVPVLAMLSEILRGKGDLVGAVDAAQRATDAAGRGGAPPGAVRRAREERAEIEETVVGEVLEPTPVPPWSPTSLLTSAGLVWYQSSRFYLFLTVLGLAGLGLALASVLQGGTLGYAWFVVSLVAAGWCYSDAEIRNEAGLFWGPFVLCLGPFGLAVYLLTKY